MSKITTAIEAGEVTLKDAEFCIKSESDFINIKYHNICTEEVYVVPTGVYDYMTGIPLLIFVVSVTGAISVMCIKCALDYLRNRY